MSLEPSSHLSSLDEWGGRKGIIPASVRGPWRKRRTQVYFVLMLIFLLTPWTKINGMQTLWLDIPARRFTVLGRVFLSHEAPLLFFILGLLVFSLALATALWGRVWCGWACPQTVFIDVIYRRIEEWVEGNYIARRKLRAAPMNFNKFMRVSLKWFAFIVVSSVIAHSFIAYFAGATPLLQMIQGAPQDNWGYFILVTVISLILTFNFGWFREQFCIIMCPYGRFQSVLMDEDSVTITYNQIRGEPRKNSVPAGQPPGDCVSCNRCVEVCPTGIDIRQGSQMECIGCTACIDACDEIMGKVKKPPHLIQYSTQRGQPIKWLRPRVLVNVLMLVIFTLGLSFNLISREAYHISILRGKDTPYQTLPSGEILNHFKLHIHNQSQSKQRFELLLLSPDARLTSQQAQYDVLQGQDREIHLFVTFDKKLTSATGDGEIQFNIRELGSGSVANRSLRLVGPRGMR